MLRSFAAFAFLIVAVGFAAGQPAPKAGSKTPAPKTSKTPKATAKGKAGNEPVEGYKKQTIEGFTVLVNDEVFAEGTEKYARKPLDVLALELGMVAKLLTPKAVETLRRLTIWVEWDEKVSLTNGREGFATAVYYGGSQASVWKDGLHPLKAGNITVLSLKSLTEEHQPKTDSGRCVLLHEMAHAVHYQLLGQESPALKAAYQQAMQRHLYEKERYLCTNEVEFFAEATCAYFNQLDYFPRTRDDLRSHDDVTYVQGARCRVGQFRRRAEAGTRRGQGRQAGERAGADRRGQVRPRREADRRDRRRRDPRAAGRAGRPGGPRGRRRRVGPRRHAAVRQARPHRR